MLLSPARDGDKREPRVERRARPRGWPLSRKILLALTLALLPMGILAAVLTVGNLRALRAAEVAEIAREAERLAREANDIVADYGLVLRTLVVQRVDSIAARSDCSVELTRIVGREPAFASIQRFNSAGVPLCASASGPLPSRAEVFRALETEGFTQPLTAQVYFDRSHRNIVYAVQDDRPQGDTIIALMPVELLRERFDNLERAGDARFGVRVASRGTELSLDPAAPIETRELAANIFGTEAYGVTVPTDISGLNIRYARPVRPLTASEAAAVAAPIAMWLVALAIAWFATRHLVVLPLTRMRRGIERRGRGEEDLQLAPLSGTTQELAAFASAFDRLSADQAAARASRQAALEAQARLMREVHHRVKNNLQIISSLLSIQARDIDDEELKRAYGVIQMRVNALSLVHRWLFEDHRARGVDFGSLAHDLVSSLETSVAAVNDIQVGVHSEIGRVYVTQDSAVPLSFLITEVAAAAGTLARGAGRLDLSISLHRDGDAGAIVMESDVFKGEDSLAPRSGTANARIALGMARQVRGKLLFDGVDGRYTLYFPLAAMTPLGAAS